MSDQPTTARDTANEGPDRIVTLTDGVVAIAMTLLALDLKPADVSRAASSRELARYFSDNATQYVAFVLAFALIAQYWTTHHRIMRSVTRHDPALTWATMLFLFGITLLPLTTFITGNFDAPLATSIFAGSLVLLSISLATMTEVIARRGLGAVGVTPAGRRRTRSREAMTILIPLTVAVLAWFLPNVSYLFLLFFAADVPGRLAERARGRRGTTAT